jgi:hypothetical protein
MALWHPQVGPHWPQQSRSYNNEPCLSLDSASPFIITSFSLPSTSPVKRPWPTSFSRSYMPRDISELKKVSLTQCHDSDKRNPHPPHPAKRPLLPLDPHIASQPSQNTSPSSVSASAPCSVFTNTSNTSLRIREAAVPARSNFGR